MMFRVVYLSLLIPNFNAVNIYLYAEMIVSLHQHHFTSSVVILSVSEHGNKVINTMVTLQRILSCKGVITVNLDIDTFHGFENIEGKHLYFLPLLDDLSMTKIMNDPVNVSDARVSVWLSVVDGNIDIDKMFQNTNIQFNSEFLVAAPRENGIQLTEIYRVGRGQPLMKYDYGTWDSSRQTVWPNRQIYTRRRDFQNTLLKAGALNGFPIVRTEMHNNTLLFTGGTIKPIVDTLKHHLNFRLDIIEPMDRKWGALENKSWNGLLGMLHKKEVDLIINIVTMSEEKVDIMDFGAAVAHTRLLLYMKKPTSSGMTWKNYIQTFNYELWIALIITILIISTIATFVECQKSALKLHQYLNTFSSSILSSFGAFCSQGVYKRDSPDTLRVVILSNFVASLVLVSSYSAFIISYLTVKKEELPFTDFSDILTDGSYKMGVLAHSSSLNMFQYTENDERRDVYMKMIAPIESSLPHTSMEGFNRICKDEKFMFLTGENIADAYMKSVPCQLITVPGVKYNIHFTLPTVKKSPYTAVLSYTILKMTQAGILKKLSSVYKNKHNDESYLPIENITLQNTASSFILLGLSILISVMLLLLEMLYNEFCTK